jgi:SAM-dependent methyltransferase
MTEGYLLDNQAPQAGQRFDGLAELFNPVTFRHMDRLGVTDGWHCWEVGVGGPSIPRWLSPRVGLSGHVLATDIDVRWVEAGVAGHLGGNVEVLRHDVAKDPAPATTRSSSGDGDVGFDLVHERLVLIHLVEREEALAQMVSALRPGGWILVEDFDSLLQPFACPDAVGPEQQLANRIRAGFRALLVGRGAELDWGRRLPRALRQAGLVDVGADAYFALALPASIELEKANVNQVRAALVAGGHASDGEIDDYLGALDGGTLDMATAPLVSAWGRKPTAPATQGQGSR